MPTDSGVFVGAGIFGAIISSSIRRAIPGMDGEGGRFCAKQSLKPPLRRTSSLSTSTPRLPDRTHDGIIHEKIWGESIPPMLVGNILPIGFLPNVTIAGFCLNPKVTFGPIAGIGQNPIFGCLYRAESAHCAEFLTIFGGLHHTVVHGLAPLKRWVNYSQCGTECQ
jgi:hypothetical protein